jgi:hypothetical protein
MAWFEKFLWYDHFWTAISVMFACLVIFSSFADRRRHRRADINNVGFVPWTFITVFSVLGTVLAAALAIKGV